jgi:hypothetical protein
VTLLLGLGCGAAGAGAIAVVWQRAAPPALAWRGFELDLALVGTWPWTAVGVAVTVLGASLVMLALLPTRERATARMELPGIDGAGHLAVRVSQATLGSLVRHEASKVEGVRSVEPMVALSPEGWSLACRVTMWRDRPMRDLAEELDRRLRHAMFEHTGVQVAQCEVDLDFGPDRRARGRVQ